jgi:hypothetical protein
MSEACISPSYDYGVGGGRPGGPYGPPPSIFDSACWSSRDEIDPVIFPRVTLPPVIFPDIVALSPVICATTDL